MHLKSLRKPWQICNENVLNIIQFIIIYQYITPIQENNFELSLNIYIYI